MAYSTDTMPLLVCIKTQQEFNRLVTLRDNLHKQGLSQVAALLEAWMTYATDQQIHAAVLALKEED